MCVCVCGRAVRLSLLCEQYCGVCVLECGILYWLELVSWGGGFVKGLSFCDRYRQGRSGGHTHTQRERELNVTNYSLIYHDDDDDDTQEGS